MESAITAGIASSTEAVTTVLTTNLPVIFGLFGTLVALAIGVKYFGKLVGRK